MATHPAPIIHDFTEITAKKFQTVKHYELQEVINGPTPLTHQINISKNRAYAKSNPDYWVKIKDGPNWSKKALTGLFPTSTPGIYYGDHEDKRHLLLFQFSKGAYRVRVFYFRNFYTRNLSPILNQINPKH